MTGATVVWVVGEPGAGKTTLVRRLLPTGSAPVVAGKVKWTIGPGACAAGTYTGAPFDGADTVPYDGAKACLEWWRDASLARRCPLTILDGERFSNATVVKWFQDNAPGVRLVCVFVETIHAASRRAARGSKQNATWVKGRASKARNFAVSFPGDKFCVDSSLKPDELAAAVRNLLS